MKRIPDKIALVTGAGAGIGAAIATRFADEGAYVYVSDVDASAAVAVAAAICERGHTAIAITLDVTRGQDIKAAFRTIAATHGLHKTRSLSHTVFILVSPPYLICVCPHSSLLVSCFYQQEGWVVELHRA